MPEGEEKKEVIPKEEEERKTLWDMFLEFLKNKEEQEKKRFVDIV